MAQKFVSLEEAATQIGISKERLNELREDQKIRAYRDGTSWKFRSDDVEKLISDGIPAPDSDISLGSLSSLDLEGSAKSDDGLPALGSALDLGGDDLELGSELELDLGDDKPLEPAAISDLSLDDLDEPTVAADAPDDDEVMLAEDGDIDDAADSILLSENELGESTDRPPSTIIGKAEMAADLDLDLAPIDSNAAAMSDVRLADGPNTSNVFNLADQGADLDLDPPGLGDTFGDLDELEIDLEAESSRILAPEDVSKAQEAAAKAQAKAAEMSDLELAAMDSSPGGVLDSMSGGSGPSLSAAGLSGLSELELDSDDDDGGVLGDGSDITLSSESSGINIISPSDSGLALDDVKLDLGSGSPLGSALDLGPGSDDADVGLEPLEVAEDDAEAEPFALTPFGEEAGEDDEDSSQVIPLDEVSEEDGLLGGRSSAADGLGDDFAAIPSGGMMPVGEPAVDLPFSAAHIAGLSMCLLLLVMCGMMVFDLVRNMWSWNEVYTLNSSLMDVLTPILG